VLIRDGHSTRVDEAGLIAELTATGAP